MDENAAPEPARASWWARHEGRLILLLALALFAANLLTARGYPVFNDDDVLLTDPGANLAAGRGFNSAAWPGQHKDELFGGNLPLYPLAIGGWLKLFGFGALQMRAFTYLAGSLAMLCFWWAIRRREWVAPAWARLACCACAFVSWPIFMAYRRNRYDSLQMLLCCLAAAVWASALRPRYKLAALFGVGALVSCAGFQAGAYLGLVCAAAWLWEGRSAFWNAAATVSGIAFGGAAMWLFLSSQDILHGLLANRQWIRMLEQGAAPPWRVHLELLVLDSLRDPSMVAFFVTLAVVVSQRGGHSWPGVRRLAVWAGGLTLAIMVGLELLLHFASFYRWMTVLPLAAMAFAALGPRWPNLSRDRRALVAAALAYVVLSGWPAGIANGAVRGLAGEWRRLDEVARRELRPDDVVFGDYVAFASVKPLVAQMYLPAYQERMSPAEAATVTVLVIRDPQLHDWYTRRYGLPQDRFARACWRWVKVAEVPRARSAMMALLARFSPAQVERFEARANHYALAIFRRHPDAAP